MVEKIFGHAPDAVSAHFGFAAIGVKHSHSSIRDIAWANQDQPISTDSLVPVGDPNRKFRGRIGDGVIRAIDVDIVVAGAVHLGELHWSWNCFV